MWWFHPVELSRTEYGQLNSKLIVGFGQSLMLKSFWKFLLERLYDVVMEITEVHVEDNCTIFLTAYESHNIVSSSALM